MRNPYGMGIHIGLKEIEALRAFMESGSITRAAARLHRTQPQVSRLLASLEEGVGFPVFVRRNRRLQLTEKGREFYRHVERTLGLFDDLKQFSARARQQHNDHVRVLATPHITEALVTDALSAMAHEWPGFTATVDSRTRGGIEFWVEHEQFDLGITTLPFEHPMFDVEEFVRAPAVIVMASDHPLASKGRIHVEDLLTERMVATSFPSLLRQRFERIVRSRGLEPDIPFETPNGLIACQMAVRGMGVTLSDPFIAMSSVHERGVIRSFEPRIELAHAFLLPVAQKASPAVLSLTAKIRIAARDRLAELTTFLER